MAGQFYRGKTVHPSSLPEVSPALFRYQRFWQRVSAYRPLLVLAGLWVVLLAIALAAYAHLLHTEKDPAQAESTPTEITVYPHQRLEDDPDQSSADANPASESNPASDASTAGTASPTPASEAANENSQTTVVGISPWSLGTLVVVCALGCSLLSRQLQTAPRPRRKVQKRIVINRQPVLIKKEPGHAASKAAPPFVPKRLATYRPNQSFGMPQSQSRNPSQAAPAPPHRRSPAVDPVDVTVVPDDTQHPLDWPQDSLVNTADVRQRRSLSSFL